MQLNDSGPLFLKGRVFPRCSVIWIKTEALKIKWLGADPMRQNLNPANFCESRRSAGETAAFVGRYQFDKPRSEQRFRPIP